jgi:hypothetical protein
MRRLSAALTVAACAAPAASSVARGASSPLGYAIAASGFNSYFVFDATPGATRHGTLLLTNLGGNPKTILLKPVDVSTASTGGLEYGLGSARREGRWLTLSASHVRLAGSARIPFTVRVPAGARPGDHFLAIAAVDQRALERHARTQGRIRLHLVSRLAMTVQVRLPGRTTRALKVGAVSIAVAPSGASVAVRVSATGNTLIPATTGELSVSQDGRTLFRQTIGLAPFVPKTSITYHAPWEGIPVEGSYRVRGELRPAGAATVRFDRTVSFGHNAISKFRRQTGRPAVSHSSLPVTVIVVLVVALAAALGFAVAYARLRRRLSERG